MEWGKNWKLELRYGRRTTPFAHYSGIAEGEVGELADGFSCRSGPAFMGMKMWASSTEEAVDMVRAIGAEIGFTTTGRIYIYETDPAEPPGENPRGYDITFTPFEKDSE
jgi:hypothetical protein